MELKFSLANRPKLYDFYTHYKSNFIVCRIEIFRNWSFKKQIEIEICKSDFESEEAFERFLSRNKKLRIANIYTAFGGVIIRCS